LSFVKKKKKKMCKKSLAYLKLFLCFVKSFFGPKPVKLSCLTKVRLFIPIAKSFLTVSVKSWEYFVWRNQSLIYVVLLKYLPNLIKHDSLPEWTWRFRINKGILFELKPRRFSLTALPLPYRRVCRRAVSA
jgi:hypothetical protein